VKRKRDASGKGLHRTWFWIAAGHGRRGNSFSIKEKQISFSTGKKKGARRKPDAAVPRRRPSPNKKDETRRPECTLKGCLSS